MWFFVAVLILYGATYTMAEWDAYLLHPVVEWAWWTFHLYVCGIAASSSRYVSLGDKVMGVFGYCLVVIYYRTMPDTYMDFLPTDTANPDLWPTVFLTINLLGPLLVITAGLLAPAVQSRR